VGTNLSKFKLRGAFCKIVKIERPKLKLNLIFNLLYKTKTKILIIYEITLRYGCFKEIKQK